MSGARPERILGALAAHPEGLSTPQIVDLSGEHIESRTSALTWYGQILRRYELKGHVRRAGQAPGGHQRAPAVIWQLVQEAREVPMSGNRLMRALVAELPPEGERFTPAQIQAWVDAAAAIFDVVYGEAEVAREAAEAAAAVVGQGRKTL